MRLPTRRILPSAASPTVLPLLLLLLLATFPQSSLSSSYLRVHSSVELWTSRLEAQPSLLFHPSHHFSRPSNTLTLDLSTRYQRILGFGGAFTEAAAVTLARLPSRVQDEVISAYFSEEGLGYSLGRVPINSCDFSVGSYNFDDATDDFLLERFDHSLHHDNLTLIPLIQRALRASVPRSSSSSSRSEGRGTPALKLFASPWSPPGWMKGNGQMTGSSSPCLKADKRYHEAWALYYVKWLQAYQQHGIPFFALTVQNEPEFAAPWEACSYTPEEMAAFVADYLSPTLQRHHLEPHILAYDHNKDHVMKWAEVVYADKRAAEAVWGLAVHWYSGDSFDLLQDAHDLSPHHHLLATEACNCPGTQINDWGRAEKYAHDIIGDLNNWVEGWTDWNLVLDERGGPNHLGNLCDAPVLVRTDHNPPSVHFQPTYYVMGHFSRFLRPGAVRVKHSLTSTERHRRVHRVGGEGSVDAGAQGMSEPQTADESSENANVEVTTFLDEEKGQVIIVLFNPSHTDEKVRIDGKGDQSVMMTVPGHSLHTLVGDSDLFE